MRGTRFIRKATAWGCAGVLVLGLARGDTQRLDIRAASHLRDGRLAVDITLRNTGDVALESVRPAVAWPGHNRMEGALLDALAPGEHEVWRLELPVPDTPPGRHTIIITARYTDRHGHPFTALHTLPVYTGVPDAPTAAWLRGTLPPIGLPDTDRMSLTLESGGPEAVSAQVHLVLPDELRSEPASFTLTLEPGRQTPCIFTVSNVWGVAQSAYRVFAVVNTVRDGRHDSLVVPGRVTIAPAPELPERRWLWALPLLCLAVFAAAQFWRPAAPR